MNHPLDGARLKVVRAQKHLDALKDEIGRYLDTQPYEFHNWVEDGATWVAGPFIKVDPPLSLSCIIGDCLGNLRKSLDYIAWELATRYSAQPPVAGSKANKGIFFPILNDPAGEGAKGFAKMAARYAFPAPAVSIIESVQPYNAGNDSLGLLSSLTNIDKHCLPLLAIAYTDTVLSQILPNEKITLQGADGSPDGGAILQLVGVSAASETAAPGSLEQHPPSVKVEGQVGVFVTLQNVPVPPEPVDRTLEQIVKCVANIIPPFDPFF